jgi:hypothetical protein
VAARRFGREWVLLGALLATLTGCGGSQDVAVGDVAEQFYFSVSRGNGAAACALLVPSTRSELAQSSGESCDKAILEEVSDARSDEDVVEVFGTMARVEYSGDTVFLTRLPDGWHVLAAGCTPRHDAPYDCDVKGG